MFAFLRCSPKVFIKDILQRVRVASKKAWKGFGVCGPRCVRWSSKESKENDCLDDDDDDCCMASLSQTPLRHPRINSRRPAPPSSSRRSNRP